MDLGGWQSLAGELTWLCTRFREHGLQLAWHNHDFEFQPLLDGTVPMRVRLEEAPALFWEIDAAWLRRGGGHEDIWIAEHGERISAVHVKDLAPPGSRLEEDGWADVGDGVMHWQPLLPRLQATPAALYGVEHDRPSDLHRFATRSMAAVQAIQRLDHTSLETGCA